MNKRLVGIIGSILFLGLLAGCAPSNTQTEPLTPERVEVTLTEFGVESTITEFEVGQPYEFVITNAGSINHEFRLLPISDGHSHSDAEHSEALLIVPEDELEAGETVTVEYTFTDTVADSTIEISCHLAGHYEAGMTLPITVSN